MPLVRTDRFELSARLPRIVRAASQSPVLPLALQRRAEYDLSMGLT